MEEKIKLTVGEALYNINASIQKMYYDIDSAFFTRILPTTMKQVIDLMHEVTKDYPELKLNVEKQTEMIQYEIDSIAKLVKDGLNGYDVKDNYLNATKNNVSHSIWGFYSCLKHHSAMILEQYIN